MLSLPPVSIGQVCQFDLPIRLLAPDGHDGDVWGIELVALNYIVAERSPSVIFELGTFDGRTTLNFAGNAPNDAKIYTIDLPKSSIDLTGLEIDPGERKYVDKSVSGTRFHNTPEAAKITQLYGDTASFDFSPWYGTVDLVFVDASHAAVYVRNDTEIAAKLIGSRPGLIIWHDYGVWPGVTSVLEEYRRTDDRFADMVHLHGTTIAFCERNTRGSSGYRPADSGLDSAREAELAVAYWRRYPDVAADGTYGLHGQFGVYGARLHFRFAGQNEGRSWGL